ncbi:MAG: UDP-2,3-diacylglucosamine diphosphatase [Candidatus Competibacterales bacterium]
MAELSYRTVWISDLHLGFQDAKAEFLLAFLENTRCDTLYIVGVFIDFLRIKRWRWRPSHQRVLDHLLERARRERVIYIPGNHDAVARRHLNTSFAGIEVLGEAIHHTGDGRRFLVTHGDEFEVPPPYRLPCWVGDGAYALLRIANRWTNQLRGLVGLPYWSLATALKAGLPSAARHIERFEIQAAHCALERGLAGIICGHIHKPALREIDGVLYCNDGDWMESCTALVEHGDGRLDILYCAETTTVLASRQPTVAPHPLSHWT